MVKMKSIKFKASICSGIGCINGVGFVLLVNYVITIYKLHNEATGDPRVGSSILRRLDGGGDVQVGSSIFHRREGGSNGSSWNVVDWKHPISTEEESRFTCTWTKFQSFLSGESVPMCVHDNDIVSNHIKQNRRWPDCDLLPVLWNIGEHRSGNNESSVIYYVDIGANIGSCVMEMLLSTNASIIAFEPHPRNIYNIKKTVSLLGESYQNRLSLFPLGLGNASDMLTINSATDNLGNSGESHGNLDSY
jgi:hypothetical protein